METYHKPVMLTECIDGLSIRKDGVYIDCTLGGGGHSKEILKNISSKGFLYAIDQDSEALEKNRKYFKGEKNIRLCYGNFFQMKTLTGVSQGEVDGVLMDLGVSSHQLDEKTRGFSFQKDGPLDMRMNRQTEKSAIDIVNTYSEEQLKKIFYEYGEERLAPKIANLIVKNRNGKPIKKTFELKEIIHSVIGSPKYRIKSCSRVFQAIRIELNQEIVVLKKALKAAYELLNEGGRLVIMSYHSLEDRIVKHFFKSKPKTVYNPERPFELLEYDSFFHIITPKPITPREQEVFENPRSRSAKLRIAEKRRRVNIP